MDAKPNRERNTLLSIRTTPEIKAALLELTQAVGKEMGTKVTQVQVVEMLIMDALRARKE